MSKYIVKVEEDPRNWRTDSSHSIELLEEMGWVEGDELVWEDNSMCEEHGEYLLHFLSKKHNNE